MSQSAPCRRQPSNSQPDSSHCVAESARSACSCQQTRSCRQLELQASLSRMLGWRRKPRVRRAGFLVIHVCLMYMSSLQVRRRHSAPRARLLRQNGYSRTKSGVRQLRKMPIWSASSVYLKKITLALTTRSDLFDATMVKVAANMRLFSGPKIAKTHHWNNWVVRE